MDSEEPQETETNNGLSGVKVPLEKLVASLGLPGEAKNQLKRIKKNQKVLAEAPHTHEQLKVRRIIGYEQAVKEVTKWEPVIMENRKTKVIYPENSAGPGIKLAPPIAKIAKPQTKMEMEVAQVLNENREFIPEKRELSLAEERALRAKSLEEAKMLRRDLLKQKALVSYHNAKMRHQNKIKSKSYRRIVRKTKESKKAVSMEEMKVKDPVAYKAWLLKEEKKRVEERMSQKHGAGSRAMTKKARYAKYDDKTRAQVQEMNDTRKELTKKVPTLLEELEELDDAEFGGSDDDSVDAGDLSMHPVPMGEQLGNDSDDDSGDDNIVRFGINPVVSVVDEQMEEEMEMEADNEPEAPRDKKKIKKAAAAKKSMKTSKKKPLDIKLATIDSVEFNSVTKSLACGDGRTEVVIENEDGFDEISAKRQMSLAEAFNDDTIIQEFIEEKKNIAEAERPKDIDLHMPGWGSWAGIGITAPKKKRRKFRAPDIPRRDRNLANVIISETKDTTIAKHQVHALPHPCKNVAEFERKMRKPLGKEWNIESKYRKLIKPTTVTRLGAIIQPISSDAVRPLKR